MKELFQKALVGMALGLAVALIIGLGTKIDGFFLTEMLNGYEYRSYDARMKARIADVEETSIDTVVIVDIEQNSIDALGRYQDWPHSYHGQLIDVISSGNPKAILFDIIFDEKSSFNYDLVNALTGEAPPQDEYLSELTQQFLVSNEPGRIVNSTYESDNVYHSLVFEQSDSLNFLYSMDAEPQGYDRPDHIINIPIDKARRLPTAERLSNTYVNLINSSKKAGSANFPQDVDGIIRRVPTGIYFEGPGHVYPSLTMAAAMDILGISNDGFNYDFEIGELTLSDSSGNVIRRIPIDEEGRMWVNYHGFFKTFYYLPYVYCFDPEMLDPSYWQGKTVLVGASLPGLMDLRNTPVQETFAGVEIHANVLLSLLDNEFILIKDKNTQLAVLILICVLLGGIVNIPKKPLYTIPVPFAGLIIWVIFAYSEFLNSLVSWEMVRPAIAIIGTFSSVFLYNFFVVEKDKRFLKNSFGAYISPELIDKMYKDKEEPTLGGEEGYHTAFFTDIQSFSSFSEILTAPKLVELLNEYLTGLTDILIENKGTLDKYIGDAIVAFYGAPAPIKNHEYHACITALRMQDELKKLRDRWRSEGEKWPDIVHQMQNRIGINSGPMVTGNMGSNMRMNYTMMGDNVNIAARLEASAKQYGIYIQVADSTYQAVKDEFVWRDLDLVRVMGKKDPVKVYELLCEAGKLSPEMTKTLNAYNEALILYKSQDWDKAKKAFEAADLIENMFPGRKTNPSRIYIPRCDHWKNNPPGDDWDGVWTLTSK